MTTPVRRMRSDEEHLLQLLFGSYNQFARPVLNSSHTVTVAIQFSLMHIKDLVSQSVSRFDDAIMTPPLPV